MTVAVTDTGSFLEITSQWGGVRVPKSQGALGAGSIPAPLQAIKRRSGTWTTIGSGTNKLTLSDVDGSSYSLTSMTATVIEDGRLRAIVRLRYVFNRADQVLAYNGIWMRLAGAINTSQTNIPVYTTGEGSNFDNDWPMSDSALPFVIENDGELMNVVSGLGTSSITVTRSYLGTAPRSNVLNALLHQGGYAAATAGDGYYECLLTLDDGLPFVRFQESCNAQGNYTFTLGEGLGSGGGNGPNTMQSQGHHHAVNSYVLVSSVQKLTLSGTVTSFTLTFSRGSSQTTSSITNAANPYTTAASIQAALEALSNVGAKNVLVTFNPAYPTVFYVLFRRTLATVSAAYMPLVTAGSVVGGGTVTPAFHESAECYELRIAGSGSTSGSFTITYSGSSASCAFSASPNTLRNNIQTALGTLGTLTTAGVLYNGNVSDGATVWAFDIFLTPVGGANGLSAGNPTSGTTTVQRKMYAYEESGTRNIYYLYLADLAYGGTTTYDHSVTWDIFNQALTRLVYQSDNAATADALGIMAGQARFNYLPDDLGAQFTGLDIITAAGPSVTVKSSVGRRVPNTTFTDRGSYQWVLWLATVEDASPCPFENATAPYMKRQNQCAGFNLYQVSTWSLTSPPTPTGGWGGIFMDSAALEAILVHVRDGDPAPVPDYASYYLYLYNAEQVAREAWDAVAGVSGKSYATLLAVFLTRFLDRAYQVYHGVGTTSGGLGATYGFTNLPAACLLDVLYARILLGHFAASLTAAQTLQVKQALLTYAYWFNSDDFVPLQPHQAPQFGTASQAVQVQTNRDLFALMFKDQPDFAANALAAETNAITSLYASVDADGASIDSTGYLISTMNPVLQELLELRLAGSDHFGTEARLPLFGLHVANLVTPPQFRLDGKRLLTPLGDGYDDDVNLFLIAMLATGINGTSGANTTLAQQLIKLWHLCGAKHDTAGFFGSTAGLIDDTIPEGSVTLASYQQPGYYLAHRYGWGTAQESAAWLVCGNTYSDHRHRDSGQLSAVFLQCPLLLDWATFHTPDMTSAYVHNAVVPVTYLTLANWYDDLTSGADTDTSGGAVTPPDTMGVLSDTQTLFLSFAQSAVATGTYTRGSDYTWVRKVRTLWWNVNYPMMLVEDTFPSGTLASSDKVCSFNICAVDNVSGPAGSYTPAYAWWGNGGGSQTYPYGNHGNALQSLTGGTVNAFLFTGPKWQGSTSSSISCNVYSIPGASTSWFISGWGFTNVLCAGKAYYETASPSNAGAWGASQPGTPFPLFSTSYRDFAYTLREKSNGSFTHLFCPYKQDSSRSTNVTSSGGVITATSTAEVVKFGDHWVSFTDGSNLKALATDNTTSQTQLGITISGGPCEVTVNGTTSTVAVCHGTTAVRTITLPNKSWTRGTITGNLSVSPAGPATSFTLTYTGPDPATVNFT